jgi:hypothetical protein
MLQGVKFLTFAGNNVLNALGSTAMGMTVGAAAPSTEAALVLGPALTLIFVVFGGLYTNQSDVPKYLRWVPACSSIKNSYDALCKNEFTGLELINEGPGSYLVGEDVLHRQGITGVVVHAGDVCFWRVRVLKQRSAESSTQCVVVCQALPTMRTISICSGAGQACTACLS